MTTFEKIILADYSLTTAEILYHMPDYPSILQTFLWQEYDLSPDFPNLHKFLNFWEKDIEGKLHSINITDCKKVNPANLIIADTMLTIH